MLTVFNLLILELNKFNSHKIYVNYKAVVSLLDPVLEFPSLQTVLLAFVIKHFINSLLIEYSLL